MRPSSAFARESPEKDNFDISNEGEENQVNKGIFFFFFFLNAEDLLGENTSKIRRA